MRDEKLGILEKLVRAGLRQVMIGVERDDPAGLALLQKHNNSAEICREAFAIFRRQYPQVYTIGTMIFGLPTDTRHDLRRLARCEYEMGMDYGFLMPLTPNPGTEITSRLRRDGYLAHGDRAGYNFHTPICRTETLGLRELESLYWRLMCPWGGRHLRRALRRLLCEREPRKRRLHRALFRHGATIALQSLWRRIRYPHRKQPTLYSRRPSWYDS